MHTLERTSPFRAVPFRPASGHRVASLRRETEEDPANTDESTRAPRATFELCLRSERAQAPVLGFTFSG